eukprot:4795209-Alexandrium_andersonii.AAC.1
MLRVLQGWCQKGEDASGQTGAGAPGTQLFPPRPGAAEEALGVDSSMLLLLPPSLRVAEFKQANSATKGVAFFGRLN